MWPPGGTGARWTLGQPYSLAITAVSVKKTAPSGGTYWDVDGTLDAIYEANPSSGASGSNPHLERGLHESQRGESMVALVLDADLLSAGMARSLGFARTKG